MKKLVAFLSVLFSYSFIFPLGAYHTPTLGAHHTPIQGAHHTPNIWRAAENGNADLIKHMIDYDRVNPNIAGPHGNTPAIVAARNGHRNVLGALYDRRADFNLANQNGEVPLMQGIWNREVVEFLAYHEANPNAVDSQGFSVLTHAIRRQAFANAQYLIETWNANVTENLFIEVTQQSRSESAQNFLRFLVERHFPVIGSNLTLIESVSQFLGEDSRLVHECFLHPERRNPFCNESTILYSLAASSALLLLYFCI